VKREDLPQIPSEALEPHMQFMMREMLDELIFKQTTIEDFECHMRCLMRLASQSGAIHADMAITSHWANMANLRDSPKEHKDDFVQKMVKAYEKHNGDEDGRLIEIWGDEHWSKKDNNISKDNMEEYPKDIQILEDKLGPQFFLCPERGYAEGKCDSEPTEEEIAKYIEFVYECESLEFYIEEKEGSWEWSCSIEGYEED